MKMQSILKMATYFSLEERESREYKQYEKEYGRLFALTDNEINSRRIKTNAEYGYKMGAFLLYIGVVMVASFSGIATWVYEFLQMAFESAYNVASTTEGLHEICFMLSAIILFAVFALFIIVAVYLLKEIYSLKRRMMILEQVQADKSRELLK